MANITKFNAVFAKFAQVLIVTTASAMFPYHAAAISFGVFDARTQALGGTGVALGSLAEGHYYNPAITAMHEGDEDITKDGRINFPLSATFSSAAITAVDAISDDLEQELTTAVNNFNSAPNVDTAAAGGSAARELQDAMRDLQGEDLFMDTYVGFSVSEPGDREGGTVFLGARVVGGGITDIEDADIDLLDQYIEAMDHISSGGDPAAQPHPSLFDVNGALINPRDNITSSAEAQAIIITEVGVSFAKQFTYRGYTFSLGAAPKAMLLNAFDEDWQVANGAFENAGTHEAILRFNADLGILAEFKDSIRVGLTVKDILPKTYETTIGSRFELEPRTRLGLAYVTDRYQVGMDIDLTPNKITNTDFERQDISFGAELSIYKNWALRAGYRQDLEDVVGNATSIGFATHFKNLVFELAYVKGDLQSGGALQFSWIQ